MTFRTGYKRDSRQIVYPSHHLMMAAAPSLLKPSLYEFRKGELWQSSFGMCTGESTARCAQLWFAANGFGPQIMLSPAWCYLVGLLSAFDGQDPDSIPWPFSDDGAEPGMEFQGLRNLGIMLEEDFPSPHSTGFRPERMFSPPLTSDLVRAYDGRGLKWFEVGASSFANVGSFQTSIRSVMARRNPVKVAMFVDSLVMRNRGEVVTVINPNDREGGGHDVAVLDASSDQWVQLDNWWNLSPELAAKLERSPVAWGAADGTWRITWECLYRHTFQALALQAAPLVQKVAA